MDLDRFEQEINQIILARGKRLREENAVKSLSVKKGKCTAYVQGTEIYKVTATLSQAGEVLRARCSCPYHAGTYCKHEAAVFLMLKEIQSGPDFDGWETFLIEEETSGI